MLRVSLQSAVQIDAETRSADRSELFYLNDEMARKIDDQMLLLFDLVDHALGNSRFFFDQPPLDLKKLFYSLLDIFDSQILILNQTMFVQFVVFYCCSCRHPKFSEKFLQLLFQTVL